MALTEARSSRSLKKTQIGGFPPKPPTGGRSASPRPPAQGRVGKVGEVLKSVTFGLIQAIVSTQEHTIRLDQGNQCGWKPLRGISCDRTGLVLDADILLTRGSKKTRLVAIAEPTSVVKSSCEGSVSFLTT